MIISLYTSRIVLKVLGVEDYGIYNAVGGVVMMFTVISGSLSSSISRFITFELGKNNLVKLSRIFCTSLQIQGGISLLILLLGEIIAVWFLNYHMNIPENPVILRQFLHQILFDLVRILILRKSEPIGYALYMCIHDHTRHVIDISADHIGCLSAYSRQT